MGFTEGLLVDSEIPPAITSSFIAILIKGFFLEVVVGMLFLIEASFAKNVLQVLSIKAAFFTGEIYMN